MKLRNVMICSRALLVSSTFGNMDTDLCLCNVMVLLQAANCLATVSHGLWAAGTISLSNLSSSHSEAVLFYVDVLRIVKQNNEYCPYMAK